MSLVKHLPTIIYILNTYVKLFNKMVPNHETTINKFLILKIQMVKHLIFKVY